jgi:hypothetical protein
VQWTFRFAGHGAQLVREMSDNTLDDVWKMNGEGGQIPAGRLGRPGPVPQNGIIVLLP